MTSVSNRKPEKRWNRRKARTTLAAYLFLLPTILLLFVFFYLPTFSAFFYSFHEYHVLTPRKWVGLDNYIQLFNDPIFLQAIKNTVLYFILIVPFLVIVSLLLAILVNRKLKGMYIFRTMYYMPYITSMVAVAIVWKYLYHPQGLVNNILQMLGCFQNSEPINWLFNPKTALISIAILEIWKVMGYYMIIYLAALQSVPEELLESARLDGANSVKTLFYITLPCLKPTIMVSTILASMNAVRIFTSVYVMTGGGPLDATMSLPMYIYKKGFLDLDMGYASAIGVILWVALMILSYLNFKIDGSEKEK